MGAGGRACCEWTREGKGRGSRGWAGREGQKGKGTGGRDRSGRGTRGRSERGSERGYGLPRGPNARDLVCVCVACGTPYLESSIGLA